MGKNCGAKGSDLNILIPDEFWAPGSVDSAKFYRACKEHDDCYETLGVRKEDCDKKFLERLIEECDRAYNGVLEHPFRIPCYEAAQAYYEAVKRAGGDPFRKAQRQAIYPIMPRFRAINDISGRLGYEGGFPNFHQTGSGEAIKFGTILCKAASMDHVSVGADQLGDPSGIEARFRAVHDYASKKGYRGGFPNFHQADHGKGVVYGTVLIKKEFADRKDVAAAELGNPNGVEAMFRAVHDYASKKGYRGGYPNFHKADHGKGIVFGVILIKKAAADHRDVSWKEIKTLYP